MACKRLSSGGEIKMRQFRVEGEWCLDEQGWRVGRVFTDRIDVSRDLGPQQFVNGLSRIEFFDRRYIQSANKILTALERQEVGTIDLGAAPQ